MTSTMQSLRIHLGESPSGAAIWTPERDSNHLIVGREGAGKTTLLRRILDQARAAGARTLLVDMDLGSSSEHAAATVADALDLLHARYASLTDLTSLTPVLIAFDGITPNREVDEGLHEIMALGRSGGIHVVLTTSEPTAHLLTGDMRDLLRSRTALGPLSRHGSALMWDRHIDTEAITVAGIGYTTGADGTPEALHVSYGPGAPGPLVR